MANKITNFVFLTLLFLLQSCSGGGIGNFLESSFNNNNNNNNNLNKLSQNDSNKKLKSDILLKDNNVLKKKDITKKIKPNNENTTPNIADKISIRKSDLNKIKKTNQNFQPKSYRVFVILKKVDPSFPTENFSKVLKNGDINFEIEKIELIPN